MKAKSTSLLFVRRFSLRFFFVDWPSTDEKGHETNRSLRVRLASTPTDTGIRIARLICILICMFDE